jgi:hypothetical protein
VAATSRDAASGPCEVDHIAAQQKRLCPPRRPGASDSGDPSLTQLFGGNAMLSFDSYREVLSEHARGHQLVWSAWIVLVVLAVLVVVFA